MLSFGVQPNSMLHMTYKYWGGGGGGKLRILWEGEAGKFREEAPSPPHQIEPWIF